MTQPVSSPVTATAGFSAKLLGWTRILLISTVWISAGLFGLYIIAFYVAAWSGNHMEKWNEILPGLYAADTHTATAGMGLHFIMGGIILLLGSIQLIAGIRNRWPLFHRWVGRIYVVACLLTAIGGLSFILLKGTIGGAVMDLGFGLYGVLMLLCAVQTWRYARQGKFELHRAWALRLYALAIGSWLYRIDYGFWFMLADKAGHQNNFEGIFDRVMSFFFYLPNLLIAELFIRANQTKRWSPLFNYLTTVVLLFLTSLLLLGTYYFTKIYWGPAIVDWVQSW